MKYLKLFEEKSKYKLKDIKSKLEELCQDLTDSGYKISIEIKRNILDHYELDKLGKLVKIKSPCEYLFKINISKYNRIFFFSDIKENVLFIKSYSEDELELKTHNIYLFNNRHCYDFKDDIQNIPLDWDISAVNICFILN